MLESGSVEELVPESAGSSEPGSPSGRSHDTALRLRADASAGAAWRDVASRANSASSPTRSALVRRRFARTVTSSPPPPRNGHAETHAGDGERTASRRTTGRLYLSTRARSSVSDRSREREAAPGALPASDPVRVRFRPARTARTYDAVVTQVRGAIAIGRLRPG